MTTKEAAALILKYVHQGAIPVASDLPVLYAATRILRAAGINIRDAAALRAIAEETR